MTEQDLIGLSITQMMDLIAVPAEPQRVALRPATDGWLWLGAVLAMAMVYAAYRWWSFYRANAYRKAALAELRTQENDAAAVATILRRTALVAYPRADIAGLQGEDWLKFLDKTSGRAAFVSEAGRQMLLAPYRTRGTPVEGLSDMAENWVRSHKPGGKA